MYALGIVVGCWFIIWGVVMVVFPGFIFRIINAWSLIPLDRYKQRYLIFYRVLGIFFIVVALLLFRVLAVDSGP